MADVEAGVGPFVSLYFSAVLHWNPEQIGAVLATQSLASMLAQTPAGWLVDWAPRKPWLLVLAAGLVSAGSFFVVGAPGEGWQRANQVLIGVGTVLVSPTVASISRGLAGRTGLSRRVGRNGAFSHAGNVTAALVAGLVGYRFGLQWVFYLSAMLGVPTIAATLAIRQQDIDPNAARAAEEPRTGPGWWQDRRLLLFAAAVVLFHVANAAMLPLAGQELARALGGRSSLYMTACLVTAQAVMVAVAWGTGRVSEQWGRRPLFLIAFGALILRAVLFGLVHHPVGIVVIEALDGLGTGMASVLTVLTISDLARGTGRFNLLQGAIQAMVVLGALLSNLGAGMLAKAAGYPLTFAALAGVATLGAAWYALLMPESTAVCGSE